MARLQINAPLAGLGFSPDGRYLFGRAHVPGDDRAGTAPRISLLEWQRAGDGSWSLKSERTMPGLRRLVATTQGVIALIEDSSPGEVLLVNVATDRRVGAVPLASGQAFPAAFAVTSDHHLAAYLGQTGTNQPDSIIEVWDLQANKLRVRLAPGIGLIRHLDFSQDLRFLACTAENIVIAYETTEFKPFNQYRHFMASRAIWCGDGASLAIPFAQENGVRLCSVMKGTDAARLTTQHQVKDVRSSLDGSVLLVAPITGTTLAMRLTGTGERLHLTGHVGGVPGVEFSPDGSKIASTGKDGMVRIWEAKTGKALQTWPIPHGGQGQTVAFSPDGRWLASGSYENNEVLVWSLEAGRPVLALGDPRPGFGETWTVAFSPDGKTLVSAGNGLRAWDLKPKPAGADGPPLQAKLLIDEAGHARNLRIDPKGEWLGFEGDFSLAGQVIKGSFVRSLDPSGKVELVDRHNLAVQSLGIVAAGRTLAHRDMDQTLRFWDSESRAPVRTLSTHSSREMASTYVLNFSVSSDGSQLAAANHNGRGVNIYDVASGRRLYSLPDDASSIWWLAWHPNGRRLAVSRSDGDISVWNLSEVEAVFASVRLLP
ncbi:MAG: hypothetical protein L0Z50_08710, partial [Verrucomicrobiales bacterium]|nr:hypothetical protein [Verrucomicrobiales bacterium]